MSFLHINTEPVRRSACLLVFTLSAVGEFGRPGDARVHSEDIRRVHGVPQIQTRRECNEDNQMLDASETRLSFKHTTDSIIVLVTDCLHCKKILNKLKPCQLWI